MVPMLEEAKNDATKLRNQTTATLGERMFAGKRRRKTRKDDLGERESVRERGVPWNAGLPAFFLLSALDVEPLPQRLPFPRKPPFSSYLPPSPPSLFLGCALPPDRRAYVGEVSV